MIVLWVNFLNLWHFAANKHSSELIEQRVTTTSMNDAKRVGGEVGWLSSDIWKVQQTPMFKFIALNLKPGSKFKPTWCWFDSKVFSFEMGRNHQLVIVCFDHFCVISLKKNICTRLVGGWVSGINFSATSRSKFQQKCWSIPNRILSRWGGDSPGLPQGSPSFPSGILRVPQLPPPLGHPPLRILLVPWEDWKSSALVASWSN